VLLSLCLGEISEWAAGVEVKKDSPPFEKVCITIVGLVIGSAAPYTHSSRTARTTSAAGWIASRCLTYDVVMIQTEDSMRRILAWGAILRYSVIYFAMCFFPAPSHVHSMISSPVAGSGGTKSDMRGPSDEKIGSTAPAIGCAMIEMEGMAQISDL
jgi:hypothetical protein